MEQGVNFDTRIDDIINVQLKRVIMKQEMP